nr:secreted RxLR effector protein 161-like [Nicotiana tomentosiformis]
MEVKSALLNDYLKEEVFVKQPPGFESKEFFDHVYMLDKALCGIKQAPRACFLVDRKSTSGIAYFLGSCLVSWATKKQNSVALSNAEAENMAATSCCAQLLWIKQ